MKKISESKAWKLYYSKKDKTWFVYPPHKSSKYQYYMSVTTIRLITMLSLIAKGKKPDEAWKMTKSLHTK